MRTLNTSVGEANWTGSLITESGAGRCNFLLGSYNGNIDA